MATENQIVWHAVKTAGKFRRGQNYTKDQLGVLGRMAVKAGVLVPITQETRRVVTTAADGTQRAVRPRSRARRGQTKGADGGEAGVQAGGGTQLRPVEGTEVGSGDDGGSQPGGDS